MKKIVLLISLLLGVYTLWAQDRTVTGKVSDTRDGSPLQGVSVKQRGKQGGVTTDASGIFSIATTGANPALEFSYVGFLSKTVNVTEGELFVTLEADPRALSEVVITGVGTATEKKRVAIDVASLNSKDVAKSAIGSVEQAIQGKIAGAQVQFNSGIPGTGATIILRGLNSLIDTKPMILLDGIEVTDLNGLDLSSVDRVEVVKGAAAGMLYGAQGANGVIQVFSKKGGRNRKPSVNIRSQVSFDQVIRLNDLIASKHHFVTDADGYILRNGQRIQPDDFGAWPDPVFEDAAADPNLQNTKPFRETVYDHLDQTYSKAMTFNNSLNISGGGERSDYAFAVSYLNQENVFANKYSRVNVGANLGFELFKGFTFRSTTQLVFTNEDLLNNDPSKGFVGTNRFNITNTWQYIDFLNRDSQGNLVVKNKQNENQLNPLSETEWRERYRKQNRIVQNVNLNYKFLRFVELDYKYGIEIWNTDDNDYYKNQVAALQSAEAFWGPSRFGSIRNDYTKDILQNSLATLFVKTDFQKDFNSNLPIRTVTQISYDWRNFSSRNYFAQGTVLPSYPPFNITVATNKNSGDLMEEFTTFGFLINQSIDWGNLLGISAGIRSDYSSEFGAANEAFTFPRGTIYFRPSELLGASWLTDWKVRAAYGEAGIQPDRYSRQVTLGVLPLGNGVGLYLPAQASNPLLRVQRSKELEIGTDVTFKPGASEWLSRIMFSGTYWNRRNEDIIQPASLSPSSGFETIIDNLTTIKSNGFDITVDMDVLEKRNLSWQFGFRFGKAKSYAEKIANGADIINGVFSIREGQEIGLFYMRDPLTSLEQTRPDGSPYIDPATKSDFEIVDGIVVNKNTKQALITDADDQKVIGSAYPRFNASFINTFNIYRNLVVSFQWDWYQGNKIYNLVNQWLYRDRQSKDYDVPLNIAGQSGTYVNYYNSLYNSVQPLGYFIEDGSFLRLRDLSLTYDFTSNLNLKWVRQVALTLAGRNLVTFTDYSGLDPEATGNEDSQGNAAVGVGAVKGSDYFRVPNLKSYQISLNIGF
jgi:TonB-dependent starch-binding outer membrane protein SusC